MTSSHHRDHPPSTSRLQQPELITRLDRIKVKVERARALRGVTPIERLDKRTAYGNYELADERPVVAPHAADAYAT